VYAVRWSTRYLRRLKKWKFTKWHVARDACWTICGIPMPFSVTKDAVKRQASGELSKATCMSCIKILGEEK